MEFEAKKNSSYLDFIKTRGNRYRLALLVSLGVISQYSGNALFSNYMNLIYNSMGITEQNQKIPVRTSGKYSHKLFLFANTRFSSTVDKPWCLWSSVLPRPSSSTALDDARSSSFPRLVRLKAGMLIRCQVN